MRLRPAGSFSAALLFAVTVVTGCGGDPQPTHEDVRAAAGQLCPVMWDWVKDVGDAFNAASRDVASLETAAERRTRWFAALGEMRTLNDQLVDDVEGMSGVGSIAAVTDEILEDVSLSNDEIGSLEALIASTPEVDEERHQARTAQLIVRIEKVIDLPKPDLIPLDPEGTLLPAFREVPSCQHAIRDVDDGVVRVNG